MKYYYLISSLPELQIDDATLSQSQLDELVDLIRQNLTPEDDAIFRCLFHVSDNQNLLYILFREYHDFEIQSFSRPLSISLETLENYRRAYSSLPEYMTSYLNDFSGSFSSLSLGEMEHRLEQYFYDYLLKKDSAFLNTYFLWRFRLKRTIADLNAKSFSFLHSRSDREEPFFTNTLSLHGLKSLEEVSTQLLPLIEANDLEGIEQQVNEYYWEFADSWREPFSAEQVFAYAVRIIHLYRWKGFTSKGQEAKENFEKLISDLKGREASPKMPLI